MSFFGSLWNVASNTRNILVNKNVEFNERTKIAKTYFWLFIKKTGNKRKLLGFQIGFFDLQTFVFTFKEIFIDRAYQFKADTDTPVILDIGANIGLATLFFKKLYPNSKIIAFEPDKETFTLLKKNIETNVQNVQLVNAAVGTNKGKVKFHSSNQSGWTAMSTTKFKGATKATQVQMVALTDYLNKPIDFLKMDIEGSETEVICSVQDKLRNVKNLVIEYHYTKQNRIIPLLEALENAGFYFKVCNTNTTLYGDGLEWYALIVASRKEQVPKPIAECPSFKSIIIGSNKSFDVTVTNQLVKQFTKLSGDHNPLHTNEQFAKKTHFGKKVVYGMLSGCLFSRLIGMYLPGEKALYLSQTLKFKTPIFEGNKLTVKGEVIEISKATKVLTIKTTVTNSKGNCVALGEAKAMYMEE